MRLHTLHSDQESKYERFVYLLKVKSSPKPVFVYLRGEHCLNAGRTLSTCGENGFPFVQQPPVSWLSGVILEITRLNRVGQSHKPDNQTQPRRPITGLEIRDFDQ